MRMNYDSVEVGLELIALSQFQGTKMSQITSHGGSESSQRRVFIYGTLKKNEPNGVELSNRNAIFIGHGTTVDKWPLVVGTSVNIPFILNKKGFGKVSSAASAISLAVNFYDFFHQQIHGEIYQIDQSTKQFLDEFEQVDQGLYSCRTIQVQQSNTGELLDAVVYMLDQFPGELLQEVLLEEYTSRNPHYPEYDKELDFSQSSEFLADQIKAKSPDC